MKQYAVTVYLVPVRYIIEANNELEAQDKAIERWENEDSCNCSVDLTEVDEV